MITNVDPTGVTVGMLNFWCGNSTSRDRICFFSIVGRTLTMTMNATQTSVGAGFMAGSTNYGGGKNDCNSLASQGFQLATTASSSSSNSSFGGLAGVPATAYYQFAACAEVTTSAGKKYVGNFVNGLLSNGQAMINRKICLDGRMSQHPIQVLRLFQDSEL